MEMDIGSYIGALLYEQDTVALPSLGSFESAYKPAVIDQVQGELHPPGKSIAFNANLVTDDGLLRGYIMKKHGLSVTEAKQMLDNYVQEVKEAIDRREIVVFPEVGRLYKDYEQNLQFLADSTNFEMQSYGLPTVSFYPIARSAHHKTTGKKTAATATVPESDPGGRLNTGLVAVIGAAVVVVGVALYFLAFGAGGQGEESLHPVPASRVNIRPGEDTQAAGAQEERLADDRAGLSADTLEQGPVPPADSDTEEPTAAPGQKSYVIIIGVFGNPKNVQRLIDDIYDAGYEPYTEKAGDLTRVGVQRTYKTEADIEAAIADVRNRFTKDAKLYRW